MSILQKYLDQKIFFILGWGIAFSYCISSASLTLNHVSAFLIVMTMIVLRNKNLNVSSFECFSFGICLMFSD